MANFCFLILLIIVGVKGQTQDLKNLMETEFLKLNSTQISGECLRDLITMQYVLKSSIYSAFTWAGKMVDATSKIRSGLELFGDDIGQFDECLEASDEHGTIFGKYCLGTISFQMPTKQSQHILKTKERIVEKSRSLAGSNAEVKMKWAACLPNSCTSDDFNIVYNLLIGEKLPISLTFTDVLCSTKEDESELSTGAAITIIFFVVIILIMLSETCYDCYCQHFEKTPVQLFIAFSMYTNSAKLFKMSKNNNNQLECLNGLKFFCMLWVVIGHTYALSVEIPMVSPMELSKWGDSLHSMFIVNGLYSVDTFFVIGGALNSFVYMQAMEKGKKFNIFLYYLHRYLRLTPALAVVALVTATIYPYFGSGPYWSNVRTDRNLCQESWWANMIYVQNYVTVPNLCLGHSWYLAVDMQLYLLSPFILYPLRKFPKQTILALIIAILAICCVNFALTWNNLYPALMSNLHVPSLAYMTDFYIKTHNRAATWLLGIIVGYFMFQIKQNKIQFRPNKFLNICVWIACISLLLFCLLIGHDFLRTPEYNYWGNSLHIAFARLLWTLGISWIMIACTFGYGGPVNWFLTFPVYQVFNRFAYSIYLVHFMVITLWTSSARVPMFFSDMLMWYYFWGNICFTSLISYFWVLAFESPVIVLEKIILGPLMSAERK